FAELAAQRLVALELRAMLLDRHPRAIGRAPSGRGLGQSARQHAAGERAVRDQAHAEGAAGGDHLELDHARAQAVQALLAPQAEEPALRGDAVRLRNVPAGEVAAADVDHLALAHQLLHRLPDFVPRRAAIDVMHLVEVDAVGLEAAQALLAGVA